MTHPLKGRKQTAEHVARRMAAKRASFVPRTEKHCSGCGETKPLIAFHKDRSSADGVQGTCISCQKAAAKLKYDPIKSRVFQLALKREVIHAYGASCYCCGESELAFLTLDHLNDDGAQHRKEIAKMRGVSFYYWLKTNGFPRDFELRVSCFNCNCARRSNLGVCPHATQREMVLSLVVADVLSNHRALEVIH